MLPSPQNYSVFPSVVQADTAVQITVIPNEKAFLFFEDKEYSVTVIPFNCDVPDYYTPSNRTVLTAKVLNGALTFSHTFEGEQEHLIILSSGNTVLQKMSVYSLYSDLAELIPFKGDLHSHSYRSDGTRDPSALAALFCEQGYDFFALTDHNRFYSGGEVDETYAGVHTSLCRVKGEEVHTPESDVHIVHVGGRSSVAELYVNDIARYEKEVKNYESRVPNHVPEAFISRYARAWWACDKIHEAGGIAIFAHPYWIPSASLSYNVCEDLAKLLLSSGLFDAYELVGGMGQVGVNLSVSLWNDMRANGLNISVVGSSDVHNVKTDATFPDYFTICFASENENDGIVYAIKAKRSVAVEASGYEYARQYRVYGEHRLVKYSHFLLKCYFPMLQRLSYGEGVAMYAYCMEGCDKALIEQLSLLSQSFKMRFFGKAAPQLPSKNVNDFESKWRAVQLQGPTTKGSHIKSSKITRQI